MSPLPLFYPFSIQILWRNKPKHVTAWRVWATPTWTALPPNFSLETLIVFQRVQKIPQHFFSKTIPAHPLPSCFFKIHFRILLTSMPSFSKRHLTCPHQIYTSNSLLPHTCLNSCTSHYPWFDPSSASSSFPNSSDYPSGLFRSWTMYKLRIIRYVVRLPAKGISSTRNLFT